MRELILIEAAGETALTRLLNTLGVVFRQASPEQALDGLAAPDGERSGLVITEEQLVAAHRLARSRNTDLSQFFSRFGCALVFPAQGTPAGAQALAEWTGGRVEMKRLGSAEGTCSAAQAALCGPFAGLQFALASAGNDCGFAFDNPRFPVERLVRLGPLDFFSKISLPTCELFVAGSNTVFDVETEVHRNINAASSFSGLAPLILFLRYCEAASWQSPRCWANVVIDDPNLRPDYGFVNFRALAKCVDELRCSVSIGFIPWNFKRTSPEVVELVRSRWPWLSLCVHGCDHGGSEFSSQTVLRAQQLITLSLERMRLLSARTGLRYDRVMVFPRGEFGAAAMQALRQSQFAGAVNTELRDRQTGRGIRAGELLKPAVTSYAGFPLFLRRPAEEPIANFALDLLLGKPCLVVTHHEYYKQGMRPFISLVSALNALAPGLSWANLGSIVGKSVWIRAHPDQATEVRLFSAVTELEDLELSGEVLFSKAESLAEKSFQIIVDGEPQACATEDGQLSFRQRSNTAKPVSIEVRVSPLDPIPPLNQPLRHRARIAARRYLSEFRENHLAKSAWATAALTSTRNLMRRLRIERL